MKLLTMTKILVVVLALAVVLLTSPADARVGCNESCASACEVDGTDDFIHCMITVNNPTLCAWSAQQIKCDCLREQRCGQCQAGASCPSE
jgi:hypothetical protein